MSAMIFYREQAERQQAEADAATLENARLRCQRAADAWTSLADRIEHTEALRDARGAQIVADAADRAAAAPPPA